MIYVLVTIQHSNFHVVKNGEVYRSAQMNGEQLANVIQKYGIKSILNLRGENPKTSWHQIELATAVKWHVIHYDWGFGAGDELTPEKMNDLITLLHHAPKPVLIHCQAGADRTGLAAALYCYAIEGQSAEDADRQLTVWYGHLPFPWLKAQAMDHSFWRYTSNQSAMANFHLRSD
jgi:protein tyrosine/serine phosphatase